MNSPAAQLLQGWRECATAVGKHVENAVPDCAGLALDQPGRFQFPESLDEDGAADSGQPAVQLAIPAWTFHQLLHDHQRPPFADHIEGPRKGAEPAVPGPWGV